jgi:hypothetical protein
MAQTLKLFRATLPQMTDEQRMKLDVWMVKSLLCGYVHNNTLFGELWEPVEINTIQTRLTNGFNYWGVRKPYQRGWLVEITRDEYDQYRAPDNSEELKDTVQSFRNTLKRLCCTLTDEDTLFESAKHRQTLVDEIQRCTQYGATKSLIKKTIDKLPPLFPRTDLKPFDLTERGNYFMDSVRHPSVRSIFSIPQEEILADFIPTELWLRPRPSPIPSPIPTLNDEQPMLLYDVRRNS